MKDDYSSERLEYQSGQRNEKEQRGEYTPARSARSCWRGC